MQYNFETVTKDKEDYNPDQDSCDCQISSSLAKVNLSFLYFGKYGSYLSGRNSLEQSLPFLDKMDDVVVENGKYDTGQDCVDKRCYNKQRN